MAERWVLEGPGQIVVTEVDGAVFVTPEGPRGPELAALLEGFVPDLVRGPGTGWSVPDAEALVRVLDRLAVEGFERVDSPASLQPFPWQGEPGRPRSPDFYAWHGRSLAAFLRRYGEPFRTILVHSATSGIRYVGRWAFYSTGKVNFVVQTEPYAVITLTGSKPHPTAEDLVIGQHAVFADQAALLHAIDRWPRD